MFVQYNVNRDLQNDHAAISVATSDCMRGIRELVKLDLELKILAAASKALARRKDFPLFRQSRHGQSTAPHLLLHLSPHTNPIRLHFTSSFPDSTLVLKRSVLPLHRGGFSLRRLSVLARQSELPSEHTRLGPERASPVGRGTFRSSPS